MRTGLLRVVLAALAATVEFPRPLRATEAKVTREPPFEFDRIQCGGDATAFSQVAAAPPHAGTPCDLCGRYRWVFVISTGRSASTTTLGMLNSIPGFLIAGEQRLPFELSLCEDAILAMAASASGAGEGAAAPIRRLEGSTDKAQRRGLRREKWVGPKVEFRYNQKEARAHEAATRARNRPKPTPTSSSSSKPAATGLVRAFSQFGFGGSRQSATRMEREARAAAVAGDPEWWCRAQQVELDSLHLESAPAGTVAVGRKAIRLDQLPTLEFLRALFPCAQFVLTYRLDETKQATSGFWGAKGGGHDATEVTSLLDNMTALLMQFQELHPKQVFAIPLEEISVQRFNDLLAWLGVRNCSFTSVCHANAQSGYTGCDNTGRLSGTCVVQAHV